MANNVLPDRIGWGPYLKPFFFKKLPPETGWSATLGSLCLLLFGLMSVTGIFLAMYYNPSPDKAYQSIDYIMKEVSAGSILRGLHHWGASAMVLVVCVHLLSVFFSGSYKAPRELTWICGVFLLLVTLGLGFTGYLLPWDMKAYWATVVGTNIPKGIPVIGDFITRAIRGGDAVTGLTLTRFYAIHTLLLPALLAAFAVFHIYLVRIHGLAGGHAGADNDTNSGQEDRLYRFYPEHAFRSLSVFAVAFLVLTGLSIIGSIPREDIAGTIIDAYLPRPEWYYMWIFQLLTYFSGPWEEVVTLVFFALVGILIFSVPFMGRPQISGKISGPADRPLSMAAGITAVTGIIYLSLVAFAGVKPYGDVIPVPDRRLTALEERGLHVYADRECAYCHQIQGRGGRRTGPDLANIAAKGKSIDYLSKFVKNPQAVHSWSIMPGYELPDKDLQALAGFLAALDFSKYPMKIVKGQDVLKSKADNPSLPPLNVRGGEVGLKSEEAITR